MARLEVYSWSLMFEILIQAHLTLVADRQVFDILLLKSVSLNCVIMISIGMSVVCLYCFNIPCPVKARQI